jgi:hypothetical protein
MANTQPFRFLDLAKELRLMVYERLPVKVRYHEFRLYIPRNAAYLYDQYGQKYPDESKAPPDMRLVHKTLHGVAVLATCRLINNEAAAILKLLLDRIRSEPTRVILTTRSLSNHRIVDLCQCLALSETNCACAKDFRKVLTIRDDYSHTRDHEKRSLTSLPECHLQIAIHNNYDNRRAPDDMMHVLDEGFNDFLHSMSIIFHPKSRHMRPLECLVRPALLSEQAKKSFAEIGPLDLDFFRPKYTGCPRAGEFIEQMEWEKDWTEGERYE